MSNDTPPKAAPATATLLTTGREAPINADANKMNEAVRELMELGVDNPRMQEGYFIDFLHEVYDSKTGKFNTEMWYKVIGTFRKGVDITNAAGDVIYTTPPIVSTVRSRIISKPTAANPSISAISDEAALQGRRHPILEKRTMDAGLKAYRPEMMYDIQSGWVKVLQRYNLIKDNTDHKSISKDQLLSDEGEDL